MIDAEFGECFASMIPLFRRCVVPPETPDGQEGEHDRVNPSGGKERCAVQFHPRVVGSHPDAKKRVREHVPEPLGRGHQSHDAACQAKRHRRGKSPDYQTEIELYRANRHAPYRSAQQPPRQLRRDGTGQSHDLPAEDKESPDPDLGQGGYAEGQDDAERASSDRGVPATDRR